MPIRGISVLKRITSGVKLIQLDENTVVASIAKVKEEMASEDGEPEEGLEENSEEDSDIEPEE